MRTENMSILEYQLEFENIAKLLPENKLSVIIDFANYLKEKVEEETPIEIQRTSNAYQEWLSNENNIYDELFKDEIE